MDKNEAYLESKIKIFFEDVKKKRTQEIYNEYIISGEIWIFKKIYGDKWFYKYDEFKKYVSSKLDVHYNDISIAGSGKLGFSINPEKEFKKFDENSDIDIIVVSQKLFYQFWDEYTLCSYSNVKFQQFRQICFGIMRKYLCLEITNSPNNLFIKWEKKTKDFEKDIQMIFNIENEVHYRIFESWSAAKDYYMNSIEKCKEKIYGEGK